MALFFHNLCSKYDIKAMGRKKQKKLEKDLKKVKPVVKSKKAKIKIEPLSKFSWMALGLFVALAFILYFQGLLFGYVLDDKIVLSENTFTKQGFDGIWKLFTTDTFQGYFGEQKELVQGGRYRPLSLVSFAIEYELFGLNPSVSHHINVLLYGLCAFWSFITLKDLLKVDDKTSSIFLSIPFMAALIFLVHPIHTEAVANIKGRDEIMAFAFSILALWSSIRYFDYKQLRWLLLTFIFFTLGLYSKENTITFLAIIPLSLILFRKWNRKSLIAVMIPSVLATVFYLGVRIGIFGYLINATPSTDIMNNPFWGMSFIQKIATIFYTLLVYIKLSFFPYPLTHDYYPYHIPVSSFTDLMVIASQLVHLILVGAIVYFWKRQKLISYGLSFYFIALSIVSNFVINVGTFMNERFIFTASLGICIIIAYALKLLSDKMAPLSQASYLPYLLVGLSGIYAFQTYQRVPAWESELTLNTEAVKVSKNSARANSFMATAFFNEYKEAEDVDERRALLAKAKPFVNKALEIYPTYLNGHIMKSGIAAEEYKMNKDIDQLLNAFRETIRYRPDVEYVTTYMKYLNDRGSDYEKLSPFYNEVGRELTQQNKEDWAIHFLILGNHIDPNNMSIRQQLINLYNKIGRPEEAQKYQ